jgi:hypothetical protein
VGIAEGLTQLIRSPSQYLVAPPTFPITRSY